MSMHNERIFAGSINVKTKDGVTRNTDAQSMNIYYQAQRHYNRKEQKEKTKHLILLNNCQ